MNAAVLLAVSLLADLPVTGAVTQHTFYNAEALYEAAARGQSPGMEGFEADSLPTGPSSTFVSPQGAPYAADPLLGAPVEAGPGQFSDVSLPFGAVGPQPYRFGWTKRADVGFLPSEGVSGGGARGSFGVWEFNTAWRHTTGWPAGMPTTIFSVTPEFNHRSWSGPTSPGLPSNVFRFAGDFELASPGNNPISYQLGFNPAFVTDFNATPNADSFNWDARGVIFLRASPQFMVAVGAAYWDRVDNIIIPYAGVVWTPNDYWEFRLLFPESRISYFLGNVWGTAAWMYGGIEYNVEAYQIGLEAPDGKNEKIQLADYRALFGIRTEGGGVSGFLEGGWVFDRQVSFLHGTPGFNINTGFIARLGLRF